ncbi:MAG TPA: hypothetical protein DCQ58_00715 [Saprospirales bacterium]|nr:hypothetical protein [Saprospirales bacterium]
MIETLDQFCANVGFWNQSPAFVGIFRNKEINHIRKVNFHTYLIQIYQIFQFERIIHLVFD